MQNSMLSQLPQIQALFAPNPHIVPGPLDTVFELKTRQEADHLAIDICQFIFTRATIVIPHEGNGCMLITPGKDDIGPCDLRTLRNALWHDSYIKSQPENMALLFTRAKKTKNKYPRKGKVRRA